MVRWRLSLLIGVCGLALSAPALAVNDITLGDGAILVIGDQASASAQADDDGSDQTAGAFGDARREDGGSRDDDEHDNNADHHFGW